MGFTVITSIKFGERERWLDSATIVLAAASQ
jgi:hypothetical protein